MPARAVMFETKEDVQEWNAEQGMATGERFTYFPARATYVETSALRKHGLRVNDGPHFPLRVETVASI